MKAALFIGMSLSLVLVLAPTPASAFHDARSFDASSLEGGGDGQYFTGSPRFKRYDCTICHQGDAARLRVASVPAALIDEGEWRPNTRYQIVVELADEDRGLASHANHNGLAVELVDSKGAPLIGLHATTPQVVLSPRGDVLFGAKEASLTRWNFELHTPGPGEQELVLYIAAVDGDGAGVEDEDAVDLQGDKVGTVAMSLCLQGRACADDLREGRPGDDNSAVRGCTASDRRQSTPWSWFCVLLAVAWRFRGRRFRGRRFDV